MLLQTPPISVLSQKIFITFYFSFIISIFLHLLVDLLYLNLLVFPLCQHYQNIFQMLVLHLLFFPYFLFLLISLSSLYLLNYIFCIFNPSSIFIFVGIIYSASILSLKLYLSILSTVANPFFPFTFCKNTIPSR